MFTKHWTAPITSSFSNGYTIDVINSETVLRFKNSTRDNDFERTYKDLLQTIEQLPEFEFGDNPMLTLYKFK